MSGLTHNPKLLGRVQGVVVHATREASEPSKGKLTYTTQIVNNKIRNYHK